MEPLQQLNFEMLKFIRKIVRIKSVNFFKPGGSLADEPVELNVARAVFDELEKFGLSPVFKGVSLFRPNVVAEVKFGKGKTLVLNGHMDTVPPAAGYSFNPFSGEVKNGKLYGLGSLDMKASLGIFVYVTKRLLNFEDDLQGKLILTFVVDEEPCACSSYGTLFLLKHGLKGDAAIIGEPGCERVTIGHRGGYRFRIKVFGEAVHTGLLEWERRWRGRNAVLDMFKVINALKGLEVPFVPSKTFPGRKPVFTFPTLIEGGKGVNMVPDECVAYGDVRLLPSNNKEQVKNLIRSRLEGLGVDYVLEDLLYVPPVEISPDEEIVNVLVKVFFDVLGFKPKVEGCGPWNDGWMFITHGVPCICGFGPDGEGAHSKNEWVNIKSIFKVAEIYFRAIKDYLSSLEEEEI